MELIYKVQIKINFIFAKLYFFFSNWFITRRHINRLRKLYERIRPSSQYDLEVRTIKLFLFSITVSAFLLAIVFQIKGNTVYNYISILSIGFILQNQLITMKIEAEDSKLLRQFEKYLGDVRHYYHNNGMIEEAIYDSLEEADYEIGLHINLIYEILQGEKWDEVENYKETAPNKYLTTFLALCQTVMIYGDSIYNDASLFLSNLGRLKEEIHIELLKGEKLKHVFSGLIFLCIFPSLFLKVIENWSISNLPELERYYSGSYGVIVVIIIFLTTILSYCLIIRLKENYYYLKEEYSILNKIGEIPIINYLFLKYAYRHANSVHYLEELIKKSVERIRVKEFLIRKVFLFIFTFLISNIIIIHLTLISKYNAIYYVKDYKGTSLNTTPFELLNYQQIIKDCANNWRKEKIEYNQGISILKQNYSISNEFILENLATDIMKRIEKYKSYEYKWYYLLVTLFISWIISKIPTVFLICRQYFLKMDMEDEVMQFQSIIIMLMCIKRMDVETILMWLENFSELFRPVLMECVDYYTYDEEKALDKLKSEGFLPLVRIAENLEACDKVGVEKAFDEIMSERSYFTEKRKQENEINITNKGVIGKAFAYIPIILTLALYLIIPFVLESVTQLLGYVGQLQGVM